MKGESICHIHTRCFPVDVGDADKKTEAPPTIRPPRRRKLPMDYKQRRPDYKHTRRRTTGTEFPQNYVEYYEGNNYFALKSPPEDTLHIRRAPYPGEGTLWPMPQHLYQDKNRLYYIKPDNFVFRASRHTCDILQSAIERYREIIFEHTHEGVHDHARYNNISVPSYGGGSYGRPADRSWTHKNIKVEERTKLVEELEISHINVTVFKKCSMYPKLESDESCKLPLYL